MHPSTRTPVRRERAPRVALGAMLLVLSLSSTAGGALESLWPEHRVRITHARDAVESVNADAGIPAGDAERRAVVEELLAAPHERLVASDLVGDLTLRSIQGTRYGIFTYPYFKARIVERDGGLWFEKLSGSQRRSGWLTPMAGDPATFVFRGASTVNDDPQRPYSRDAGAAGPAEGDSVGVLYRIGDGRLVMLLDASPDGYEIYQAKR
jgi:hypothetical protein